MIRIYTDAAVSGSPGYAGVGILILDKDEQKQITHPLSGKQWDNHQAEFEALVCALKWLIKNNKNNQMVFCYTDSQIVAQSIDKNYAKNTIFKNYLIEIQKLIEEFTYINIEWIPEKENRGADNLARQALQKVINKD